MGALDRDRQVLTPYDTQQQMFVDASEPWQIGTGHQLPGNADNWRARNLLKLKRNLCTRRFGNTTKVLAKSMLKYYKIS